MPKFSQFFRSGRFWIVGCMAIVVAACVPLEVKTIGHHLDGIGKALDEFGTVSVSSPLLADVRKLPKEEEGLFNFKLTAGPDDYYKDAKKDVQGVGAVFSQRGVEFTGGLRVRANLEDLLTNQIRMNRFNEDERRFRQRGALQDAGAMLGLLIPLIDPKLALADALTGAVDGAMNPDDGGSASATATAGGAMAPANQTTANADSTSGDDELEPDEEATRRLQELIKALMATSTGLSGATSRPSIPEFTHNPPEISDDVLAKNDLVEQLVENEKFERFRALLGNMPTSQPVINNRSAIITAAGDTMVESIMTYLGQPVLKNDWKDKVVLMGVSMVSVAPGTRTQRGYVADVAVKCTLEWRVADPPRELVGDANVSTLMRRLATLQEAYGFGDTTYDGIIKSINSSAHGDLNDPAVQRQLCAELFKRSEAWNNPRNVELFEISPTAKGNRLTPIDRRFIAHPVVSAASPMTEAHTFDFASSIRQQQAFAFKLAAIMAGFGAEAEVQTLFKEFDRLEQDLQTRTPINTVAAYSNAGSTFGYQIGPNLVGLADFVTTRREGGAFEMLGKLIAGEVKPGPDMVLQRQSFPVALFIGLNKRDIAPRLAYNPALKEIRVVEPAIKFEQTTRWIPVKKSRMDDSLTPRPRIPEHQRVEWAWRLADAKRRADNFVADKDNADQPYFQEFQDYVDSRADTMRSQALVASSYQTMPAELVWMSTDYAAPTGLAPSISANLPVSIIGEHESNGRSANGRQRAWVALTGNNLGPDVVYSAGIAPNSGHRSSRGGDDAIRIVRTVQYDDAILMELEFGPSSARADRSFQVRLSYQGKKGLSSVDSPPFRIVSDGRRLAASHRRNASEKLLGVVSHVGPNGEGLRIDSNDMDAETRRTLGRIFRR